jgi:predicted RNase H-like nuclease (RuvC/YqgF family)
MDEMRDEIENLKKELAQVRTTISSQVSEALKRMLSAITRLADQLRTEHESLLEQLTYRLLHQFT